MLIAKVFLKVSLNHPCVWQINKMISTSSKVNFPRKQVTFRSLIFKCTVIYSKFCYSYGTFYYLLTFKRTHWGNIFHNISIYYIWLLYDKSRKPPTFYYMYILKYIAAHVRLFPVPIESRFVQLNQIGVIHVKFNVESISTFSYVYMTPSREARITEERSTWAIQRPGVYAIQPLYLNPWKLGRRPR